MKKTLFFLAALLTFGLAANAQTVWSEDFENTDLTGWTTYSDNLTNYSSYSSYNNSWQVAALNNGDHVALSVSYTTVFEDCDRWLITPSISIPTGDNYSLVFQVCGYTASYPEKVRVLVSTTGIAKTDFTQVLDIVMDGNAYVADYNDVLVSLAAYAGQDVYIAFVNHGDGYYTFIDNLEVKVVPDVEFALTNVKAPSFAGLGENFNASVTVRNLGCMPLTSFDLTYDVNGVNAQTVTVSGINVAPYAYYTRNISMSHSTVENITINAAVSNPNGETDPDVSDNSGSANVVIYNPAEAFTRNNALLEHFTTQSCQYCPGGHERLGQAYSGFEDRVAWVAHHSGFNTDQMTIPASANDIIRMYGGGGTWAPAMMLDRNCDFFPDQEGAVGSVGQASAIVSLFNQAVAQPALVNLAIDSWSFNPSSRELTITVSGSSIIDMTDAHISLYITEDDIHAAQTSTSGTIQNYQHDHVLRATVGGSWGEAISITAGSPFTKTFTYTIPATWKARTCRAIVFVNRYDAATGIDERHVMNAVKTDYISNITAVENVEATMTIKTRPNPATEMAFVEAESAIHSYTMVNAMGQVVMAAEGLNVDALELNVSDLAAGIYYITIATDNGTAAQRLSVVK